MKQSKLEQPLLTKLLCMFVGIHRDPKITTEVTEVTGL